jgi:hypothetical protein
MSCKKGVLEPCKEGVEKNYVRNSLGFSNRGCGICAILPQPTPPPVNETTITAESPEAVAIAADGALPVGDPVNNCWFFTNSGGNKINWYFYGDGNVGSPWVPRSRFPLSDLECFYFVVTLSNYGTLQQEFNKPWITVYTQYDPDDVANNVAWYRSRYNYTGFYDNGNAPGNTLPSGKYLFYIGDLNSLAKYDSSLTEYKLSDYTPSFPFPNVAPGNPDPLGDGLMLIAISSDSGAADGTFNFCINEVGYKLKDQDQEIIETVA